MKLLVFLSLLAMSASANPFAPSSTNDAKTELLHNLLSQATPTANSQLHRNLANNQAVNIAGYSVMFEQCQFVKTYSDNLADDESSDTVLEIKRFVVFRLCPNHDCSSCTSNFGEYIVDLGTYLSYTTTYFQKYEEAMCTVCDATCTVAEEEVVAEDAAAADDAAAGEGGRRLNKNEYYFSGEVDCSVCVSECENVANAEANGFVDAVNFLNCPVIYNYDGSSLYAGPICASNGKKINVGVFTDAYCNNIDTSKKVEDYIMNNNGGQASLNHALLKKTYTNTCISCAEPRQEQDNNHGDDAEDDDKVIEMCEQLYNVAAKCEKTYGFDDGLDNYYNYDNQLANEEVVCDFVNSLKSGSYNEQGEIIVGSYARVQSGATTGGQKFALTVFVLGTAGLAVYASMLHAKLTKGGRSFSASGGALA